MTAALRIDARRPRWKPLPQPHALERAYYARLMAVVNRTFGLLRKKLAAHLPADARRQDAAEDEPPDNFRAVTFTIEEVEFELAESFPATSVRKAAESTAKEIDNAHLRATRRQFSEATGIDILREAPKLRKTVEEFTKENVALIKSIPKEAMEGLRHALVTAGLEKGVRPERLAKMLQERYGVAQRRAQLIATDQVGKMMASLTEERHRELGVTKYRWRTSRDNRVRRLHARREGKVFEYDKPPREEPGDGHAGHSFRCRCFQEPLLDEVLPVSEAIETEKKTVDPAPSNAKPASPAPVERIAVVAKRTEKMAALQVQKAKAKAPAASAPKTAPAKKPAPPAPNPVAVAKAIRKPTARPPSPLTAPVKPPAKVRVPKSIAPAGVVSPAEAVQPVPVDRAKGWKYERVYLVPIEELADIPAMAWNGRDKSIRKAYEAGKWEELPPIQVMTENKETGARELQDGNHRLAVARELGAKFIKVRFLDKGAASVRARPPNPGLPWFVREDPERYGYRIPEPGK